jgi:VanZ family protein
MTILCIASSFSVDSPKEAPKEAPKIPHFDKITHFGYFFGGGIILTTWLLIKYGSKSSRITRIFLPILFFSIFGAIDEYRQTFTPGRSGNDFYDWLADLLGGSFGVIMANDFHPFLLKFLSPTTTEPEN